jgi:hypothetical protein
VDVRKQSTLEKRAAARESMEAASKLALHIEQYWLNDLTCAREDFYTMIRKLTEVSSHDPGLGLRAGTGYLRKAPFGSRPRRCGRMGHLDDACCRLIVWPR